MSGQIATSLLASASLFELSPAHVDEGERIGFLHEDKAAAIGRLMAVDGQRDPIKVVANPGNTDRPWKLVTGMHRLIGARLEGITVFAIEVSGKPEDLADLEASENLHRRPLAPIERAKFVHALCQAARERIARELGVGELKSQKMAIHARWQQVKDREKTVAAALTDEVDDTTAKLAGVYGWVESTVDALDLGKRTIERALRLYRLVIEPFPALAEDLSRHPIVGENEKQLLDIAAVLEESDRRKVIEALLADRELSADEARVLVGVQTKKTEANSATEKFTATISGTWGRLSLSEQNGYLPRFVELLTPGQKTELRQLLATGPKEESVEGIIDVTGMFGGPNNG